MSMRMVVKMSYKLYVDGSKKKKKIITITISILHINSRCKYMK